MSFTIRRCYEKGLCTPAASVLRFFWCTVVVPLWLYQGLIKRFTDCGPATVVMLTQECVFTYILCTHKSGCLSIYLSIYLSICIYIYIDIYIYIYRYIYIYIDI